MKTIYEEAKNERDQLQDKVNNASDAFKKYPRSSIGMISDSIRKTDQYEKEYLDYLRAFEALRNFNKIFTKVFKKEIKEDIKIKRSQK